MFCQQTSVGVRTPPSRGEVKLGKLNSTNVLIRQVWADKKFFERNPDRRHRVRRVSRLELYRRARRYVTVTGAQFGSCRQLTEIDSLIDALLAARPQQKPAGKKRTVLKSTRTDVVELIKPSLLTHCGFRTGTSIESRSTAAAP